MGKHKSAKEIWEERIAGEQRKPSKAADGGLGHDELQERWAERYPNMAWSRGNWHQYQDGYWQVVNDSLVEWQIIDVLKGSRDDGVKVTGALIGSVLRIAKAETYVDNEMWDSNADALVMENGTLDISTRTLREHRLEDYATNYVPYAYDPKASAKVFQKVLEQAIPDARDFLQEFAGYSLTTDTSLETAVWLKGPRGCGKSTVIEGLVTMLGERHDTLGLAEIEASRFALARIPGKTLLSSTEQPASYLKSTHIIDALISGELITVERKNVDVERVRPQAKIIWAMNEAPRIGSAHGGIFRRVKIITFPPLTNKPEPALKAAIHEEGPGILNWALDGLDRLKERGHFDPPESVTGATHEWEKSNDLPSQFAEEHCTVSPEGEVAASLLYSNFRQWAIDNGHQPPSSNRVAEDWKRLGFKRVVIHGRRFWKGVMLNGSQL